MSQSANSSHFDFAWEAAADALSCALVAAACTWDVSTFGALTEDTAFFAAPTAEPTEENFCASLSAHATTFASKAFPISPANSLTFSYARCIASAIL